MTSQQQQNDSATCTPPAPPDGQSGMPARLEGNAAAPIVSQAHQEVRIANNTLNTFIGGKPKSWMLNENAVQVLGGDTVPPTVRQQSGPLLLRKTPRSSPTPTQQDQGPAQSPSMFRRLPSLVTEKAVAGTAEGAYQINAPFDSTEVSPRPATDKGANFGSIRQGGSRDQSVDLYTESAGVGHTLPSPAPSNSSPGPEHQQPLGRAGQKRPCGDLNSQDTRSSKRQLSTPEAAADEQPRRFSRTVHGVTGNNIIGRNTGVGDNGNELTETTFGPRTVFTPASSPLPSPSHPTPVTTTSNQVLVGHDRSPVAKLIATHDIRMRIQYFERQLAANNVLHNVCDTTRAHLLKLAICKDDLVYLLIHQICCLVALSLEEAYQHANITPMHRKGVGFMQGYFPNPGQPVSQAGLRFFAEFPWKYGSQEMQNPLVAGALRVARHFLSEGYQAIGRIQELSCQGQHCPTSVAIQCALGFRSEILGMLVASTARDVVTRYMNALHGGALQNRAVTETVEAQATAKRNTASNTPYQAPVLGSNSSPPPTPLSVMFPNANGTQQSWGGYSQGLHGPQSRVVNQASPSQTPSQYLQRVQMLPQQPPQQLRLHQQQQLQQHVYQQQQTPQMQDHMQRQWRLQQQPQAPAQQGQPHQQHASNPFYPPQQQQRQPMRVPQSGFPHAIPNWHEAYPHRLQQPMEFVMHPSVGLRQELEDPHQQLPHCRPRIDSTALPTPMYNENLYWHALFGAPPGGQSQPPPPSPPSVPAVQENLLQLHLQSPKMVLNQEVDASDPLHFTIADVPIKLMALTSSIETRSWEIPIGADCHLAKMLDATNPIERPLRNNIKPGSRIYELRCIEVKTKSGEPKPTTDADWIRKESIWPRNIFIEINGERLEIRRKEAWGKDYPADITNGVKPGVNTVSIVYLGGSAESTFYAGVEAYVCTRESKIKSLLLENCDPIKSKTEITRRLSSGPVNDNNDVIISSNTVTISVRCPLSFQLINTPVRGPTCAHIECFDFDAYMKSRIRAKPDLPPRGDSYKCPHCKKLARPEDLIIDGFVDGVLKELRKNPALSEEVASIIVDQNGDWRVKRRSEDVSTPVARQDSVGSTPGASTVMRDPAVTAVRNQVEVICIDDD